LPADNPGVMTGQHIKCLVAADLTYDDLADKLNKPLRCKTRLRVAGETPTSKAMCLHLHVYTSSAIRCGSQTSSIVVSIAKP
jgi:hypothetical protein